MEDLGWTILYIPKFYKVISSKGGKFYTFKNLTRSSAQGVENFIHTKILNSQYWIRWIPNIQIADSGFRSRALDSTS